MTRRLSSIRRPAASTILVAIVAVIAGLIFFLTGTPAPAAQSPGPAAPTVLSSPAQAQ